jgi:hypothetical protein
MNPLFNHNHVTGCKQRRKWNISCKMNLKVGGYHHEMRVRQRKDKIEGESGSTHLIGALEGWR